MLGSLPQRGQGGIKLDSVLGRGGGRGEGVLSLPSSLKFCPEQQAEKTQELFRRHAGLPLPSSSESLLPLVHLLLSSSTASLSSPTHSSFLGFRVA